MEFIKGIIDLFLHLDKHLGEVIAQYGAWTYFVLFMIVFCETGLVITPFLPGDSLLFAAGAFAATGSFNVGLLILLLCIAAILGDALNYAIGNYLGPRLKEQGKVRFIKQEHLDRTHKFYEKYGKMTIILARFVPIVRTFAPFLAGVGSMSYIQFATYNVIGGVVWVVSFTLAGYFFGNLPFVKDNFSMVILAIIVLSIMPIVIEYWKHRREEAQTKPAIEGTPAE